MPRRRSSSTASHSDAGSSHYTDVASSAAATDEAVNEFLLKHVVDKRAVEKAISHDAYNYAPHGNAATGYRDGGLGDGYGSTSAYFHDRKSYSKNPNLVRRGTAENGATLRLANTLRAPMFSYTATPTDVGRGEAPSLSRKHGTAPYQRYKREGWNASTSTTRQPHAAARGGPGSARGFGFALGCEDPLITLLRNNLAKQRQQRRAEPPSEDPKK